MKAAHKALTANIAARVPGSVVRTRIFLPKPQVPLGNPVLPVICLGHLFSLVLRNNQKMLAQILEQTLVPPPFYRVEHTLLILLVKSQHW